FFIAFAQAAQGDVRAGAIAGGLVGLLFLARAEGSLFGVALLALAARRSSRRAGAVGALIAVAVGLAWLVRGQLLGGSPDLLAASRDAGLVLPLARRVLSLRDGARRTRRRGLARAARRGHAAADGDRYVRRRRSARSLRPRDVGHRVQRALPRSPGGAGRHTA